MVKDEVGNKYGRWTVLSKAKVDRTKYAEWVCICECGVTKVVKGIYLRNGDSKSCGCYNRDRISKLNSTHKFSNTSIYKVWKGMVQRCTNKNSTAFKNYGGRGIKICEEWQNPETFCSWAMENGYKKGLQIDREDNDKGYSPENCSFVTPYTNSMNRRIRRTSKTMAVGIELRESGNFQASIASKFFEGKRIITIGTYPTLKSAIKARNNYIVRNNIPHKIQPV